MVAKTKEIMMKHFVTRDNGTILVTLMFMSVNLVMFRKAKHTFYFMNGCQQCNWKILHTFVFSTHSKANV